MFETTPTSNLAHQISFAVFRVAKLVRNKKLRTELENCAVDLVKELSVESLETLNRIVGLAESVGEMNKINSSVLQRELGNLRQLILAQDYESTPENEAVYLGDIFGRIQKKRGNHSANPEGEYKEIERVRSKNGDNKNAEERQTAIKEFIRQFPGDCRMKDLSAEFTEVSERTLRNDIQALIEERLVDRMGGRSGPSSYFVAVENREVSADGLPEKILLPEATRL